MTLDEAIEKFERQEKVAQIMLSTEYGAMPGVRDHVHQERKELAEWALKGLWTLKEQEEKKHGV